MLVGMRLKRSMVALVVVFGLAGLRQGQAQEKGSWQPLSTTARSVTGPISFANEKLTINFTKFAVAEIRDVSAAEIQAVLQEAPTAGGATPRGHLFRLNIPGGKQFLRHNTMCGSEDTQWMVTSVQEKTLQLAFFSGSQMPVLTAEAVANTTALCGTYTYGR